MAARRHPIYTLPFDEPIHEALEIEYRARPLGRRFQARRKAFARDALLALTGQAARHVAAVPAGVRHVLWVYTWTTVGDAILDLAPRRLIPSGVTVDLLIAPQLAPLFAADARFRGVHTEAEACPANIDFVLLDSLRTISLRLRSARYPKVPFATMRGHHAGERFDRAAFADRRLRQLFGLPLGPVEPPRLDLGAALPARGASNGFRIAIALGARLPPKLYSHWPAVIERLALRWPASQARPEFVLLGHGRPAERQRDLIEASVSARAGVSVTSLVGSGDLRKAALDLAACDAFLGVDGGLMHVAIGVGTPGLALFTKVDPTYFLRPESSMLAYATGGELDAIAPAAVAVAFFAGLPRMRAARGA